MVDYDPSSDEVQRDPYPLYARMREAGPVHWAESCRGWVLPRFAEQWELTQDNVRLSTRGGTTPQYLVARAIPALPNLNHMDPPSHTALRSALAPFFLPRRVNTVEPLVREVVRECLDRLLERGEACVVRDVGQIVASRLACFAIGFPREDSGYIVDLVNRFIARDPDFAGVPPAAVAAFEEMQRYLASVARARRAHRGAPENPIDVLIQARVEGEPLDDEIVGQHLILLLVGATETFPKAFASAALRLWQHPDQRRWLAANPGFVPAALRECLRYDMPTQFAMRQVVQDFELHGEKLRRGDNLLFLWPSGNRDAREFPDPDRFDVRRNPLRFLSFGNGTHRCLGNHFAQMEGKVLLEELLARAPEYEIDESRAARVRSELFRGYARLPILAGRAVH
jgi:hypothetical protein